MKTFEEVISQLDIWEDWRKRYNYFVPQFIEEAKTGKNWTEWDKDIFYEFFEKSNNQCVSSLKQGYFTNKEKGNIRDNWEELAPLLQILALSQDEPRFDIYKQIKIFLRQYTSQDRRAATNRLVASLQPKLLCSVVNEHNMWQLFNYLKNNIGDVEIPEFIGGDWFKNSFNLWQLYQFQIKDKDYSEIVTLPWETFEYFRGNHHLTNIKDNDMSEENILIKEAIELLNYKNQIILQGAPGTGKTYNARLIADQLIKNQITVKDKPKTINDSDILSLITQGLQISSVSNYTQYKIEKIENEKIELSGNNIEHKYISFNKIISSYTNKQWEPNKIKNNLDSYEAALAYYIYNNIEDVIDIKDKEKYIKLVQFHPSYTYEDFVRGIVVDTEKGYLDYISQNKILGAFAKEACENWNLYKLGQTNQVNEALIEKSKFDQFIDKIQQEIDENGKYQLTPNVYLFEYDDNRFKYKGDGWSVYYRGLPMKYTELKKVFDSQYLERSKIKKIEDIAPTTRQHVSYYTKMANDYYEFQPDTTKIESKIVELKNYVLIIDEINRANLPAVLGELIYALEYRGKKVESMYAVDENNSLILPPNLYIIGTMNTADRSVGQIDYAIRRRFAFIDMLPTILTDEETFDQDLFKVVSKFFIENIDEYILDNSVHLISSEHLSNEFRPEDVWIGHSYFIMKDSSRDMRLRYEIKPILKEYLKDGILKESAREIIESL